MATCQIYGVSQGEVWKALLKHRWDIGILGTSPCLNENQIAEVIVKTGQDLNLKYDWNIWIHEEDLAFGTQLYTTLCQCPGKLVEAAKLSAFFDSLLTSQCINCLFPMLRAYDTVLRLEAPGTGCQGIDIGDSIFSSVTT